MIWLLLWLVPAGFDWLFMIINLNGWIVDDDEYTPSSFLLMLIPIINLVVMSFAILFIFSAIYKYFYRLFTRTDQFGRKKPDREERIANELDRYKLKDIEKYLRKKKLSKLE